MTAPSSALDRLTRILQQQFFDKDEAPTIAETTTLESLGANELDRVEFIMLVENEFALSITDAEAERFRTVGDVVRLVTAPRE